MENLDPMQNEAPKEMEKFADLLGIVVTNLKEAKCEDELVSVTFYCKLFHKLPEKMLAQYHHWIFEK